MTQSVYGPVSSLLQRISLLKQFSSYVPSGACMSSKDDIIHYPTALSTLTPFHVVKYPCLQIFENGGSRYVHN